MGKTEIFTMQTEAGTEFRARYRNEHGSGYDLIVSTPLFGNVDILLYQVVCHEVPEEPSSSFSLPLHAVAGAIQILTAGHNQAAHTVRQKHYH